MKKVYLTLVIIIGAIISTVAQPTLTTSNYVPLVGDTQFYYIADTNSVIDPTIGANVTFNYSGLHGYGQTQTQYFVDPSTTTYATDFPTATYADTTGGFPINKKYSRVEAIDSLTNIGLVADVTTFGTIVAKYNQDPEILMQFPFNYNDNYTDNYSGTFVVQGVNTNGNGNASVISDAWGTLNLPMGVTIDSVIRVKTVEFLTTDTIVIPFPPITILPFIINAEYINYYKPSISKFPLLSIVRGSYIQNNNVLDSNNFFISQYPMYLVGVEELSKNMNISIFPNPSNNNITSISFDLKNKTIVKVNIFNNLGQNVKEVFDGNLPQGKNILKVKTSYLNKGLYFINIRINNRISTKKLLIE